MHPSAQQAVPQTADTPSVLFVDDEERILGALTALFRQQYNVLVSTHGVDALEQVRRHKPGVIVSDQRMPGMAGVEFLRQARDIDPSSVRILLTGYADLAAIVGSINEGEIFRFVSKPWGNLELRRTIAEAMDIASSTRGAMAPGAARAAETPSRESSAVLVLQDGDELHERINNVFGHAHAIYHTRSVTSALQLIEAREISIIVCDLDGVEGGGVMLKLLKQSRPRIHAIVVTATADSQALVALINQAQVFRFLGRPLRTDLLERGVRNALESYAKLRREPVLETRHKVEPAPEASQSPAMMDIARRVALLRQRMGAGNR